MATVVTEALAVDTSRAAIKKRDGMIACALLPPSAQAASFCCCYCGTTLRCPIWTRFSGVKSLHLSLPIGDVIHKC